MRLSTHAALVAWTGPLLASMVLAGVATVHASAPTLACPAGEPTITELLGNAQSVDPAATVKSYTGMDATAVIAALTKVFGAAPPGNAPASVSIVRLPSQPAGVFIYVYDVDGCYTADAALGNDEFAGVLSEAKVAP